MAWKSGFFNSVNGDRLYNADTFNTLFEGLITNGVFESVDNKLAVQPNSGMTIQIATGKGWFSNHWLKNTSAKLIELQASDVTLNRYAAIVIRVDESNSVRSVEPVVKYSELATTPIKPTMTRSATVNEYCLAYVLIKAGAKSITASDIEDTRSNTALCGWVTGLIEQIDANTLYTQFTDIFNEWFNSLQDLIDSNVETTLVNALPVSVTVTLLANGWSQAEDGYTQDVTVSNMNTTKSVIVEADSVECIAQSTNKLTFKSGTLLAEDISVKVVHMGV